MSKIGIIAGGGKLPKEIITYLQASNQEFCVIGLKGETDLDLPPDISCSWHDLGKIGQILSTLKEASVTKLVLAGKIKRPSLSVFKVDSIGIRLVSRLAKARIFGDDALLKVITGFLEEEGFNIIAPEILLPKLLAPFGVLGKIVPTDQDLTDIQIGIKVLRTTDILDIGQAVIVEKNLILGLEAVEGTDALISRCMALKREKMRCGVLVKLKKTAQEGRVDLPTIGMTTIELINEANISGIALEASNALILELDKTIELADKLGIFIIGV